MTKNNPLFFLMIALQVAVLVLLLFMRDGVTLCVVGTISAAIMFYTKLKYTKWKIYLTPGKKSGMDENESRTETIYTLIGVPTLLACLYVGSRVFNGEVSGFVFWMSIVFMLSIVIGALAEAIVKLRV